MDVLDEAVDRVRGWPAARRAEAAELLLALDELGTEPVTVDDDTLAAIDEALEQISGGQRADKRQVEALLARYRS